MSAAEQNRPSTKNGSQRKERRAWLHRLVLVLLLVLPFGLYLALDAGNDRVAGLFFTLIALCMALIVWKG